MKNFPKSTPPWCSTFTNAHQSQSTDFLIAHFSASIFARMSHRSPSVAGRGAIGSMSRRAQGSAEFRCDQRIPCR